VTTTKPAPARRRYDNTLRRERAAQTRERIVTAGAELVHTSSLRDWRGVTIRAVANRAGVNERTVYRHFANERALRDAVMHRLEGDAGIDLDGLALDAIADVTARIFRYVSAYPREPKPPLDPTLVEANRRQHDALLAAVEPHTASWPEGDRRLAAAMFDVLWAVGAYERLVVDWELDDEAAIRAITWVIGMVEDAVRTGARPSAPTRRPARKETK
jgi:AcrR family transcriptional regulator